MTDKCSNCEILKSEITRLSKIVQRTADPAGKKDSAESKLIELIEQLAKVVKDFKKKD